MGNEHVSVAGAGKEDAELLVICDQEGNEYNLAVIPDRDTPIIRESSASILQEMQIDSIIQNLENVGKLMFIAYNALSSTMIQSSMSGLQKRYLELIDDSNLTILHFKMRSLEICKNVAASYKWLLKGKEGMALTQFKKCAVAASDMADKAEQLAVGFQKLSDDAEKVLEKTQDESSLQYKKIDEVKQQMLQYDANLKKCESLRDSLNEDIESINQIYQEARTKEKSLFNMNKGLMITQIVTSCIGALIPAASSVASGSENGNQKMADTAKEDLSKKEQEKKELSKRQESGKAQIAELEAKKAALQRETQDIQQKIRLEEGMTAKEESEREANITKYREELSQKEDEWKTLEEELESAQSDLRNLDSQVDTLTDAIDKLNEQLSKFAESCQSDLERAEEASKEALKKKLDLENQRRETLASIQEFAGLIKLGAEQKNVAETAVQTLGVAIRCIKQVVVALMTAAKFWRSMESYCRTLAEQNMADAIQELSAELSLEERMEYYQDDDFKMTFLAYICRWAALYYVCDDYKKRNDKVRGMVADNMQSSSDRDTEWRMAGELANEMGISVQKQVEESRETSAKLEKGVA